jgi:hypothetical protein
MRIYNPTTGFECLICHQATLCYKGSESPELSNGTDAPALSDLSEKDKPWDKHRVTLTKWLITIEAQTLSLS